MANSTDDREQLKAALAIVVKQIRGLRDLANVAFSDNLLVIIRAALAARERRRTLINGVLASIDARMALNADGYPSLDPIEMPPALFAELQDEIANVGAAAGIFDAMEMASHLVIGLGQPAPKP